MYFNMMDLLAGFMVHIGLQEADYMDKGNILDDAIPDNDRTGMGKEYHRHAQSIKDMEEKLNKTLSHLEADSEHW